MAVQLSSHAQPFVTHVDPDSIRREEQHLRDAEILYLEVPNGENGTKEIGAIGDIFVGLQNPKQTIKKFNDVELCFAHIRGRSNVKIYLILSHGLTEEKMSTLKEYSNVALAYDFSSPSPWIRYEGESGDCGSVNLIFDQINRRHHQFHDDRVSENSTEFLPRNDITDSRLFITYQLLMEILYILPETEVSKKEFTSSCIKNYSTKPGIQQEMDEFNRDYKPDQAIKWYTKQSFVNRIVSRTFATNDLRLIYNIRYFIRHLHAELKELYPQTFAIFGPQIVAYRGKIMSINEFDKFNASIGKLVITKSFVSTSLNIEVARFYSGYPNVRAGYVAVIIRMTIDMVENKSKALAFIGEKSCMTDEDEVLLAFGIIFRNKNIHKQEENMFIIDFVHTSAEEEFEERVIHSNTDHLERAQGTQSPDTFYLLFDNIVEPRNEQETPQPSKIQNDEENNQTMEPQTAAAIKHQTTEEINEQFLRRIAETMQVSLGAAKRLWKEINQLRQSSICSGPPVIFKIDQSPFDEGQTSTVIIGRILPLSTVYNQHEFKIEIRFPPAYPFSPPEIRFLTRIYHPNVAQNGAVSLSILRHIDSWSSTTSLTSVLQALVDLIHHPSIDLILNAEAAYEYDTNRAEFERKALEMAQQYGLPRE